LLGRKEKVGYKVDRNWRGNMKDEDKDTLILKELTNKDQISGTLTIVGHTFQLEKPNIVIFHSPDREVYLIHLIKVIKDKPSNAFLEANKELGDSVYK
jgi:hypothetical protein